MVNTEREKLKILLEHWIEHNGEHRQEYADWAEKAKAFGAAEVAGIMLKAAQEMGKASEYLAQARQRLEGK